MNTINWQSITAQFDPRFELLTQRQVGGGCINRCYQLQGKAGQNYFIKLNHARYQSMFAAEALSLQSLAQTQTVTTPTVLFYGQSEQFSFLALSYHPLSPRGNFRLLGQQLAHLHQQTQPYFGFEADNFIGNTPQLNSPSDSWLTFWRDYRLMPQLDLAKQNRLDPQLQLLGKQLVSMMPHFLEHHSVKPALLHGDLWSGNCGFSEYGDPMLFDPACYYGDPECDLAMTELFGGFPAEFYQAYYQIQPRLPGYSQRRQLYNLYHILNHANLFGASYSQQAKQMILSLLEAR